MLLFQLPHTCIVLSVSFNSGKSFQVTRIVLVPLSSVSSKKIIKKKKERKEAFLTLWICRIRFKILVVSLNAGLMGVAVL